MNKFLVILMTLALVSVGNANTLVSGVNSGDTWLGYVNCFNTDGTYAGWGSAWGTADLPASWPTATTLVLAPNTNCYNATDSYWVDPVTLLGNKIVEADMYREWDGGLLSGQTVTFDYTVQANTLPAGYVAQAFIKVLDPTAGWATVQSTFLNLTPGAGSLSLAVGNYAVTQVGFMVKGLDCDPLGSTALTGVTIVPEPATVSLLAIGGLLLRRRK
ncbi:MAG: PEP-CTERM sorting domain-containing protein [Sedimentisphaerales bacterium]|jgi:hypothetical protein